MKKKEFAKLKVGDKVRIVSKKVGTGWNNEGKMDKWLGKVMTIRYINKLTNWAFMVEDQHENCSFFGCGWAWGAEQIAEKIEPVKEVKRVAKVGEYIKIVDPYFNLGYVKGDILKVEAVLLFGGVQCWTKYKNCGHMETISQIEYVVLENYVPEEKPEVKKPEPKKDEQPTIVEHLIKDRKTIVKLSNGKVGVAVCSPEDEFDEYEGLRLAIARAYGKAETYKKPATVKEVKRKAKKGEYIKIVKPWGAEYRYKKGDILRVVVSSNWAGNIECYVNEFHNSCTVLPEEYVVLENYQPTK